MERDLTEKQVMKIHEIIERHSTDVVDYELATDDINAYLLAVPSEPQASPRCTCGHLVTVHYGPGNPCCFCHCEHFVPERDAPEPAKPQASEPTRFRKLGVMDGTDWKYDYQLDCCWIDGRKFVPLPSNIPMPTPEVAKPQARKNYEGYCCEAAWREAAQ